MDSLQKYKAALLQLGKGCTQTKLRTVGITQSETKALDDITLLENCTGSLFHAAGLLGPSSHPGGNNPFHTLVKVRPFSECMHQKNYSITQKLQPRQQIFRCLSPDGGQAEDLGNDCKENDASLWKQSIVTDQQ